MLVPFQFDRAKTTLGNFSYLTIARLKPGETIEQAYTDVARMLPIVGQSFPPPPGFNLKMFEDAHFQPNIKPMKSRVIGDIGKVLWVLMASIGMVLLIACANVANLVLVRVEGRRQELAIRAALGARRAQTMHDYLASRGVQPHRMRTISYGKERPVAVCDDISCWSQNRRAVTVLNASS